MQRLHEPRIPKLAVIYQPGQPERGWGAGVRLQEGQLPVLPLTKPCDFRQVTSFLESSYYVKGITIAPTHRDTAGIK